MTVTTLDQALDILGTGTPRILAGGTDFYPALHDRPAPGDVLDITGIAALKTITCEDAGWRIGSGVTWTGLIRHDLPPAFDALKAAGREVGSIQIQNKATVAGNLCNASPAADGVPPLFALEASVELASSAGTRRLPLSDFITGVRQTARRPDELVTAILVPAIGETATSHFHKLGSRRYLVISIAMIAIVLDITDDRIADIRIAVGACSPVARRLATLEAKLTGQPAGTDPGSLVSRDDLAVLSPIDDVRGSAEYRLNAVEELLRRMLSAALGE